MKQVATIIVLLLIVSGTFPYSPTVIKPVRAMEGLYPKFEPVQHISTNLNLYVSAENLLFKNYFAGPMVIQVIIADPDINRLDQKYGEPLLNVNGMRLRMMQGTDGNWYGYFADRNQAIAAANTAIVSGKGLNFGGFCGPKSQAVGGFDFSQTMGFTIARGGHNSINRTDGGPIAVSNLPACITSAGTLTTKQMEHVVRQNETLNTSPLGFAASQDLVNIWPVIQLFDFSAFPTPVAVDYQKAGGDQIVNLIFDQIPPNLIRVYAARPDFCRGCEVQGDLLDPQLNIDPTDVDSWTWGASPTNNTLYYMAFDRNGKPDADGTLAMQDLSGNLTTFMFNHNGRVTEQAKPQGVVVFKSQSNGIQTLFADSAGHMRTQSISGLSAPITLREIEPNAGIFSDYDEGGIADLVIKDDAPRGKSFIVSYNDKSYSVVVKFHTATLKIG